MNRTRASAVDHHFIAQVQSRVTGENAHDIYRLLAQYLELSHVSDDITFAARYQAIEQQLRSFSRTGVLPRKALD